MVDMPTGYIVVLKCTKAAGGYAGVITQTSFPTKADFDSWLAAGGAKEEEVLEHGITQDRATALCRQTPLKCYMNAAVEAATDPKTGETNLEVLNFKLANLGIAVSDRAAESVEQDLEDPFRVPGGYAYRGRE